MKQNYQTCPNSILSSFELAVQKYKRVDVCVEDPACLPFVLSAIKGLVIVLVEDVFFDDVFGCFPQKDSSLVGVPLIKKTALSFFGYHQTLFNRAYYKISSDLPNLRCCFVEKSLFKKKLFSDKKNKRFVVDFNSCSFDGLVEYLQRSGYKRVEEVGGVGDFSIRGFVVDVFSFGYSDFFRFNFFDSCVEVFVVDVGGTFYKKNKESFYILPKSHGEKESLFSLLNKNPYYKIKYKKNKLSIVGVNLGLSGSLFFKNSFMSFNFSDFKNKKTKNRVFVSPFLLFSGCLYNNNYILPNWFVLDSPVEVKPTSLHKKVFKDGSYYIHEDYGVCLYLGLEENEKQPRVCLRLQDGLLKMDVQFLNKLSYYAPPESSCNLGFLNKTGAWHQRKNKTINQVEEYASMLVKAYSQRSGSTKKPCVYDSLFLKSFISKFPYKDTGDQILAWGDVLNDLCSNKPMNRLLCGDVGFGKTEIALRAIFVSVFSSKKVVVLTPTTLLCDQFYRCCVRRLSDFGVRVGRVSRITSNNASVLKGFFSKNLFDVLIGTHAVVKTKNTLKLVDFFIVDEEHRFGVKDKEALFSHNPSADFLSMSATPIPRTLQMSLSGVRNISTLSTPPKLRKPIITDVVVFNKTLLKNFLLRELGRGGQVFVVDNSVNNVKLLYNTIKSFLPTFSIGLIFGSLNKNEIKKTMLDFRNKKINVLVSTTIIESGLDIASANTIIINNAHMFGLSQLHQLRGRVGRSRVQGYAVLFVPNKTSFTKEGVSRLKSIQLYSDLGSGYRLALKDLEIRGSGSLFGFSQSGSSSVGFEYYSKLLGVVVARLFKNKKNNLNPALLPRVDLGKSYIPVDYIPLSSDRIAFYSSLSSLFSLDGLGVELDLVKNKFGPPPPPVLNLFNSKKISLFLYNKNISSVLLRRNKVVEFVYNGGVGVPFDVFQFSLDSFFKSHQLDYKFKEVGGVFKFQFNHNNKDVYILTQKLIETLYE